jgi:hypothetical protein
MQSPTARTLEFLRRAGYFPAVVERFIAQAGITQDLYGCIDVVAVKVGEPGVLAVQTTTAEHLAHRLHKAQTRPELRVWLAAQNRFILHGWKNIAGRWRVRVVELTAADLQGVEVVPLPKKRRLKRGERQALLFQE